MVGLQMLRIAGNTEEEVTDSRRYGRSVWRLGGSLVIKRNQHIMETSYRGLDLDGFFRMIKERKMGKKCGTWDVR
jgi:hypothetical protein